MIMKTKFLTMMLCGCLAVATSSAQEEHSDIEFGYFDGGIGFESDGPGINAAGVFEAEFEVFNPDGTQEAEDPGFASNFMEGSESFLVTSGDSIFLNANQSSTLGTYLAYFNPATGQFESTDATFVVEDNSPGGTMDMIIGEDGLMGDMSQFLVTSDGSEIDTHVDFILSSGAQDGAYGLLLNLESDNLSGDLGDVRSDRFWIVFNNGLDDAVFESAVQRFVVPEPSSFMVLSLAMAGMLRRRRV